MGEGLELDSEAWGAQGLRSPNLTLTELEERGLQVEAGTLGRLSGERRHGQATPQGRQGCTPGREARPRKAVSSWAVLLGCPGTSPPGRRRGQGLPQQQEARALPGARETPVGALPAASWTRNAGIISRSPPPPMRGGGPSPDLQGVAHAAWGGTPRRAAPRARGRPQLAVP